MLILASVRVDDSKINKRLMSGTVQQNNENILNLNFVIEDIVGYKFN